MLTQNDQKLELLNKTVEFYRQSIANYTQFTKTERAKPRTKKQLELRLQTILLEIESLKVKSE